MYTTIGNANFASANFGVDGRQAHTPTMPATGRITESDLTDMRRGFVEPPGFAEATGILAAERLIFLSGPAGRGKRTSALHLLRRSVDSDIFLLSPRMSATELAQRSYKSGCGYALIDHVGDEGNEGAFGWRMLRDRLAECDARLVITTSALPPRLPSEFRMGEWFAPDLREVLRERMSVQLSDADLELIDGALDGVVRVGDTAELARRLDAGEPVDKAIRNLDVTAAEVVREWFDRSPNRRRVAEVTAMAFAMETPARTYDRMLGALLRRLREVTVEETETETDMVMPTMRAGIVEPGGLIVRRTATIELGASTYFSFEEPSYHRHVVRALWERYDSERLWNPVRRWLDDVVGHWDMSIVIGLAALSEVDINEVLEIIDPWSRRRCGIAGQFAAMLTLSAMACRDELAPSALRIATVWITKGDPTQRHTAAVAFSGAIGVRYPHDAVNRLWQLSMQPHTSAGDVDMALPELFATLIRVDADPSVVLTSIVSKIRKFGQPGANVEIRKRLRGLVLRIMSTWDRSSGRRSLAAYAAKPRSNPAVVARIWTWMLDTRPTRRAALELFRLVAEDLVEHENEPERILLPLARRIGERHTGLAADSLAVDFRRVNLGPRNTSRNEVTALMRQCAAEFGRIAIGENK
ncbi:hypothetical protein IU427_33080 [Nocardia beijingensis]|uniref:hypothetical protein n=1 Tax=Nocardia beijingensis TaxID=95162 RepID=UPI0018941167|nr:hypothetical protein [Nocardia beijingensis]MBF6469955.1 hypothetical protein [Nocardia beijingensis]